ncbi:trimethylamine-N-oxide reductase (cytochrome c) [Flavobacteriaceae bacterium UJ101]|nr:trimethylamine-N-oxide reductase (cytochrome c) [Flavobacteriaceae bacterium UJ101]
MNRRDFLELSSIAATGVALGGLTLFSCDHQFDNETVLIPHACHWGPFKAVVKNGTLIGVQPLKEFDEMPTQMLTKGVLSRVYDKTRIKYPMVRRSYLEGLRTGNTKPELRGKDSFVRLTWDEALALTSNAIVDVMEKYGNGSLFSSSYGGWSHAGILRPHVLQGRFFGLIGGHSITKGDYSGGASQISLPHIIGDMEVYSPQTAWKVLERNTELVVLIGCDPWKNSRVEYRVADHQMYPIWKKLKEKGVQFVSINPHYTNTDEVLDAEWIKIIPNTDTALFTAMSYYIYQTGMYDKAYLNKYTVGFDRYLAYLLGEEGDDIPKTPEWAAKITGISAKKIIELAELCASKRTQFAPGWSVQRAQHGEMTHWSMINFAAMLGKIGKRGEGIGFSFHYGNGGTLQSGKTVPGGLPQGRNPVKTKCPASRISEMLLNPGKKYMHNGHESVFPNAKLVYNSGNNFMSHQQDTNELIRALNQQVKTIICQDPWWCASARFADIVLPATSTLERDGLASGGTYSNDRIYAMRQVIEPVGESLNDFEIFRRLAAIFGVEEKFTGGKTNFQILQEAYENSDGKKVMPFNEFWEKGIVRLEVPEEAKNWTRHGAFYENPMLNPLHTNSGKIELYSSVIDGFKAKGCPPMPKFIEPMEYLGNAKKGQLHVLGPHPNMRLHSQMANADIRKIENIQGRQHILINTEDAKERGISNGDLVEVYNKRGTLLAGAKVTDIIMKGVLSLEEGNWIQLDSKGRCNSGSINMLTPSIASSDLSQATSANTCLAYLKKCTDPESENKAFEPPEIEENYQYKMIYLGLAPRIETLKEQFASANMTPGEALFYNKCSICHAPHEPKELTLKQWEGVMQGMAPRAGLKGDEKKLVMDFLAENAKK